MQQQNETMGQISRSSYVGKKDFLSWSFKIDSTYAAEIF